MVWLIVAASAVVLVWLAWWSSGRAKALPRGGYSRRGGGAGEAHFQSQLNDTDGPGRN